VQHFGINEPHVVDRSFKGGEIVLRRGELSLEEQGNSLLQLDHLIPIQFAETLRRNTYVEPERILMLAVLEDAIYCLQKHATCARGRNRRLFDETINWVQTQDEEWLFSFENVCDTVGVNAERLRRVLLQMVAGRYRVKRAALHSAARGHRSGALRARG
jgi:hypothetical protein